MTSWGVPLLHTTIPRMKIGNLENATKWQELQLLRLFLLFTFRRIVSLHSLYLRNTPLDLTRSRLIQLPLLLLPSFHSFFIPRH